MMLLTPNDVQMNSFWRFLLSTHPSWLLFFPNDNNDYDNNTPGTPPYDVFLNNEVVEDAVIPNSPITNSNDKYIYDDTLIDDDNSITSVIDPLQDKILEIEVVDA